MELIFQLQKTMSQSDELKKQLESLSSTNGSLYFYAQKLTSKINEFSATHSDDGGKKCIICYTRKATHTICFCGHTSCEPCAKRSLISQRCFICRKKPERIMKIFNN